jgi:hypothetical protein
VDAFRTRQAVEHPLIREEEVWDDCRKKTSEDRLFLVLVDYKSLDSITCDGADGQSINCGVLVSGT